MTAGGSTRYGGAIGAPGRLRLRGGHGSARRIPLYNVVPPSVARSSRGRMASAADASLKNVRRFTDVTILTARLTLAGALACAVSACGGPSPAIVRGTLAVEG